MSFPLIPYLVAYEEGIDVDDVTPELILKYFPNADPYRHLRDE